MKSIRLLVIATMIMGTTSLAMAEGENKPDANAAMAAVMEKAKQYTQPSAAHQVLSRFLGDWNSETRLIFPGAPAQGEKGRATFSWLMEGRWLQMKGSGQFLGQTVESVSIMGYDNFKQSYVVTSITSIDTAMNRAEGDMDPSGKALILYGTIDEYLTGEHDKMVKTVWRFVSDKEMRMEIHDLPIGENNTQVVEVRYWRE